MNQANTQKDSDSQQQQPLSFPRSIRSVSREEFNNQPMKLSVKKGLTENEGELPGDLDGSVFIIAAVGNVASKPVTSSETIDPDKIIIPAEDGWTSMLNGDGMVYRLDFIKNQETKCEAHLFSRIIKTPSYFADQITHPNTQNIYNKFRFYNIGLARVSPYLGVSNQVNTAFLPMPFSGNTNRRLLATWDVGRPYEIDPDSLKIIAPVGFNSDWNQIVENLPAFPFPQNMSSAHPCFDPEKEEMFTVNVVKSLNTLLQVSTLINDDVKKCTTDLPAWSPWRKIIKVFAEFLKGWSDVCLNIVECLGLGREDATYLIRWNGSSSLQKWKVTHRNRPVKIKSTMHQMGISKDYVILTETAFKLVLEDFIPSISTQLLKQLKNLNQRLSPQEIFDKIITWIRFHRQYLTFPQSPDTNFYIVSRDQLNRVKPGDSIEAEKFTISGECNHFLVDYDNPNGKITIHAALNKASDAAEFIHQDDTSPFPDQNPKELAGIFSNGMAVNRPAIYLVDGASGRKEKEEILDLNQSKAYTWSIGLYAYRDYLPTQKFEDIYWLGFGAWQDTQTQLIYDLYKDYIYRDMQMPLDKIMEAIEQGVPTILSRLHIDRNAKPILNIVDSYKIPGQYFANSPQFVPKKNTQGSTEGYIICTVIYSDHLISYKESDKNPDWSNNSEIWVFDAENLSQGPLSRLSHPKLNLSFTVHTTWLQDHTPTPTRKYDVRQDFQWLVNEALKYHSSDVGQEMLDLFNQVYAAFERDRKST